MRMDLNAAAPLRFYNFPLLNVELGVERWWLGRGWLRKLSFEAEKCHACRSAVAVVHRPAESVWRTYAEVARSRRPSSMAGPEGPGLRVSDSSWLGEFRAGVAWVSVGAES